MERRRNLKQDQDPEVEVNEVQADIEKDQGLIQDQTRKDEDIQGQDPEVDQEVIIAEGEENPGAEVAMENAAVVGLLIIERL